MMYWHLGAGQEIQVNKKVQFLKFLTNFQP